MKTLIYLFISLYLGMIYTAIMVAFGEWLCGRIEHKREARHGHIN